MPPLGRRPDRAPPTSRGPGRLGDGVPLQRRRLGGPGEVRYCVSQDTGGRTEGHASGLLPSNIDRVVTSAATHPSVDDDPTVKTTRSKGVGGKPKGWSSVHKSGKGPTPELVPGTPRHRSHRAFGCEGRDVASVPTVSEVTGPGSHLEKTPESPVSVGGPSSDSTTRHPREA